MASQLFPVVDPTPLFNPLWRKCLKCVCFPDRGERWGLWVGEVVTARICQDSGFLGQLLSRGMGLSNRTNVTGPGAWPLHVGPLWGQLYIEKNAVFL